MMRNFTEEEKKLWNKYHNDKELTEKEKKKILERLKKIDKEQTKDYPFCH